jgi:hypothetical protein
MAAIRRKPLLLLYIGGSRFDNSTLPWIPTYSRNSPVVIARPLASAPESSTTNRTNANRAG